MKVSDFFKWLNVAAFTSTIMLRAFWWKTEWLAYSALSVAIFGSMAWVFTSFIEMSERRPSAGYVLGIAISLYLACRFYVWVLMPHGSDAVIDDSISDYLRMLWMEPNMKVVLSVVEKIGTVSGIVAAMASLGMAGQKSFLRHLYLLSLPIIATLVLDVGDWAGIAVVLGGILKIYIVIASWWVLIIPLTPEPVTKP